MDKLDPGRFSGLSVLMGCSFAGCFPGWAADVGVIVWLSMFALKVWRTVLYTTVRRQSDRSLLGVVQFREVNQQLTMPAFLSSHSTGKDSHSYSLFEGVKLAICLVYFGPSFQSRSEVAVLIQRKPAKSVGPSLLNGLPRFVDMHYFLDVVLPSRSPDLCILSAALLSSIVLPRRQSIDRS